MKNQFENEIKEKILQIIPCTKPLVALFRDENQPENPIKEEIYLFALVEQDFGRYKERVIRAIDRDLEFVDKISNFMRLEPGNE